MDSSQNQLRPATRGQQRLNVRRYNYLFHNRIETSKLLLYYFPWSWSVIYLRSGSLLSICFDPQYSSHFSLVFGDPITNRNIEYGSVDDSSVPPLSSNTLLFLSFVFAWNPNKGVISQRVRWDSFPACIRVLSLRFI
jgi:hypothetical protein